MLGGGAIEQMADKRKALSFQRSPKRLRKANPKSNDSWHDFFATFGTTFMAIATLAVAIAQWRTAERQTDIADSLAQLEFAKSDGHFSIVASSAVQPFKTGLTDRKVTLNKSIKVSVGEGVRELSLVDVPISFTLMNAEGDKHCQIELRGVYLDDDDHLSTLWQPSTQYLGSLLMQFEAHGLYVITTSLRVRLAYTDLLGRQRTKYLNLNGEEAGGPTVSGVPLYTGARSGGHGFYTDEGAPETFCPDAAKLLKEVLAAEGGQAGHDYDAPSPGTSPAK